MDQAQDLKNNKEWDDCITKARNMLKTEGHVYHYVYTAKSHICHCQAQVCLAFTLSVCVFTTLFITLCGIWAWDTVTSNQLLCFMILAGRGLI